ncbi:MAG: AbrB/MazE/SpoVT family DNA-binding domain-containing protein [Candidatus Promineifilaceae bacterium]
MKEHFSLVTRKGQITIPAEIRRALDLQEGDTVALVMEGEQVRLWPTEGVVARTAGLLKGGGPVLTAEEEREAVEQAIAEDVAERGEGT